MRIAVDVMTICDQEGGVGAGIEHYTWSLLYALVRAAPQHIFFLLVPHAFSQIRIRCFAKGIKNVRFLRTSSVKIPFFTRHLWQAFRLALPRPDLLFSPSGQYPIFYHGPTVATIHDVLIYRHPDWFSKHQRSAFSTRIGVPISIGRAKHLITVSEFTQRELHRLFPVTKEKTTVVYEGVDSFELPSVSVSDRFPYDRDYVLFIGTLEPRKNLEHALQAFHLFLESHPDHAKQTRFVLAGARGWGTEGIEQEWERVNQAWHHVEPHGVVQWLGKVTEEEKWALLARATCLLFPSYEEGFGLPVLEAMCVGTPVITTRRGALEEVGGDVPIYVDPDDVEAISLAIAQCVLVPEGLEIFEQEGMRHAARFSWERAAQGVLSVLQSM